MLADIHQELKLLANPTKAKVLQGFFKTSKGHYGHGDMFYGIQVPHTKNVCKKYFSLSLKDAQSLLYSPVHEERLASLFILVDQYQRAKKNKNAALQQRIVNFYLQHARQVNNWDLVDSSADKILGDCLLDRDKSVLLKLAHSNNLWEKRISIIATFAFIKNGQSEWTFKIAKLLLRDEHDLIHKAVGWMLREVGKRVSQKEEETFLKKHAAHMPRTMLRYAIEKFEPKKRLYYLKMK